MIRRINKLKNVGRFAELRSQGGNQHEFAKVNVIYAPNASGKTTLCDVFRSLGTGKSDFILGRRRFGASTPMEIEILLHGSPTPKAVFDPLGWQMQPVGSSAQHILVYDDRFVADNVLVGQFIAVEQRRNVYGLALGHHGLILKEAVDTADRELGAATTALNLAKAALTPHIPAGFDVETFRSLENDEAIDQNIAEANEQLEAEKRAKQNADSIRQRKPLGVHAAPSIPTGVAEALASTLDDAALRAEAEIRQHLQRHSHGLSLEWLNQGHRAKLGTTCPHCGQEMKGLEILTAYRSFFSGALQAQTITQDRISKEGEDIFGSLAQQRLKDFFEAHVTERNWWNEVGGLLFELPPHPSLESISNGMEDVRSAITGAFQRKQAQPAQPVVLNNTESDALARWMELSSLVAIYMAAIEPINNSIAERQRVAGMVNVLPIEKRITALNAQKKRHETDVAAAYTAFDKATSNKTRKDKAKATANKALREQSEKTLSEYGDRINDLLARFNVGFRLASGGVNFHGGPPAGDLAIEILGTRVSTTPEDARNPGRPSLANTLSGGDRSALGLAFFVAVAERDPNITDSILVFDDPFHSQDRSRRRRTIECVHRLATASRQCFILSHELDFAREASRIAGIPVNTFLLDPMSDHSRLESKSLPPLPGRAYEQDYTKLTAYLRSPADYADQLKDVARCIRQALEGYFRTKFPESWEDNDWLGDMIGKIRAALPGDLLHHAGHYVSDLTDVNDWGKRFYHSETDGSDAGTVDPAELLGYVAQTIGIISR